MTNRETYVKDLEAMVEKRGAYIKELRAKIDGVKKENQQLHSECERLTAENAEANRQYCEERERMADAMDTLTAENARLMAKDEATLAENERLRKIIQADNDSWLALRAENARLTGALAEAQRYVYLLTQENALLRAGYPYQLPAQTTLTASGSGELTPLDAARRDAPSREAKDPEWEWLCARAEGRERTASLAAPSPDAEQGAVCVPRGRPQWRDGSGRDGDGAGVRGEPHDLPPLYAHAPASAAEGEAR